MINSENKNELIQIYIVIFTFLGSMGLYYSNPDQFVSDDSLFYVVIAQNILDTGLSTFNGYIETNGYHPLWQVLSVFGVAISRLLSLDPLIGVGFIYHIFMAGSLYLVYKIEKVVHFFSFPIVSMIFIFLFIANGTLHNMESAVALFFVLYTLYFGIKIDHPNSKQFFIFGLILGLTFLARLDLVFFGIIIALYVMYRYRKSFISKPKYFVYFIIGGLLTVIPYFIYNMYTFGSIAPVSGALKSSFPIVNFSLTKIFPYGIVSILFSLVALILAYKVSSKKIKFLLVTLSVATIMHALYLAMFQFPMSWYFITGYVTMAFVIGYFLQKINYLKLTYLSLIVLLVAIFVTSYMKTISNYTLSQHFLGNGKLLYSKESRKKLFGEAFRKGLPENTTVFSWDLPGALAYYGKLRVFSADGLITNKEYQIELAKDGARTVFEKYKIQYIISPYKGIEWMWYDGMLFSPLENNNYQFTIYSRLYHKKSGSLILNEGDIVLNTSAIFNDLTTIGTFKIPAEGKRDVWINFE